MNLLLLLLRKEIKQRFLICFGLYIDKTCVSNVFSESPLNTDTRIIRTLWHVPLVSVLTGFHCIWKSETICARVLEKKGKISFPLPSALSL